MIDRKPDRRGWVQGGLLELPSEGPFPQFTEFEQRALKDIAVLFKADKHAFLKQLESAQVTDRINTICGFYTSIKVDRSKCHPVSFDCQGGWFEVEAVEHGMGITLWGDEGFLDTIEGYSVDDNALDGRKLAHLKYLSVESLG